MKKTLPDGFAEELQRFEKGLRWILPCAEADIARRDMTWKTPGALEAVLVWVHVEMLKRHATRLGAPPDRLRDLIMQFFDQFVEDKERLHMLLEPKGHPEGH